MKKSIVVFLTLSVYLSLYCTTVTNTSDSGAGSFRQAVIDTPDTGTIDFAIPTSPFEIDFTSGVITFSKKLNINPYNGGNNIIFSSSTYSLDITTGNGFTMNGSNSIWEIDMAVAGVAGTVILMDNPGTLILNAVSSGFFGEIELLKGTLEVGGTLGPSSGTGDILVFATGTTLNLRDQSEIFMKLAIFHPMTVSVLTGTGAISGVMSGTGAINKNGPGVLVLNGANTNSGLTTVSGGTLTLNGSLAGPVTVNSGATVNGIGSIVGAVTVSGTVDSIASIAGAVTVNSGATVNGIGSIVGAVTVDGTMNTINSITGNVIVNPQATVNAINSITGDVFVANSTMNAIDSIVGDIQVLGGVLGIITQTTGVVYVDYQGTMSGNGSATMAGTNLTIANQGVISGFNSMAFTGPMIVQDSTINGNGTGSLSGATLAMTNQGEINAFNSIAFTGAMTVSASEMHGNGTSSLSGTSLAMTSSSVIDGFNSITFPGALTVNGSTISGDGTGSITAAVTVTGGEISGFNSITGAVTVNGGSISEIGSISGLLNVSGGGVFSPGNPFGTTTLGSLHLAVDSITNIEIREFSSSAIDVTVNANILGTLNITQNGSLFYRSASYEIVKVGGALTGTFGQITGANFGFDFSLNQVGNSIYLDYTTGLISTQGLTGNILTFANYLNEIPLIGNGYLVLAELSGETLYNALNSASPARNAFPLFVTQQTVFNLSRLLNERLRGKKFLDSLNASDALAEILLPYEHEFVADNSYYYPLQKTGKSKKEKYAFWITGFADLAHQNGESQNVPFNFNSEGVLFGFDVEGTYKDIAGVVVGYAQSKVDDYSNMQKIIDEYYNMGKSNISYYIASLYANYVVENFYLEGALWGVFHQIENTRNIFYSDVNSMASSSINGWQLAPHAEIGYVFDGQTFDFEPYAGVDYVVNWEGGTEETGAGTLDMRQKSNTFSMIQAEGGIRFYQSFKTENSVFGFKEGFSYINRTPFNTGKITSAIFGSSEFFTLTSFQASQNLGAISFVYFVEAGKDRNVIFSLGYEGQFGSEYMLNEVSLSVSKSF